MRRRDFLAGLGAGAGAAWAGMQPAAGGAAAQAAGRPSALQAPDWRSVSAQFQLPPGAGYFNTAGLGASPRAVTDCVKAMMDREEEAPSPGHSEGDWARIRGKCAALLGPACTPDEVALVSTATEGLNIILNGLPLTRGDEVITSTHEHVALAVPLLHKIRTAGISVKTFDPDPAAGPGVVERVRALLTTRTRLIIVSHVTCTTGQRLPVAEIGRLAVERGVFFALDGAQALAQFPLDVVGTGAHFYAASCHKWLMGPKRTGVLYVRRDHLDDLVPSIVGAYSDRSHSLAERRLVLQPNARRFEYGTQNDALVYGLEAALDYVNRLGLASIADHNRALADRFIEALRAIPGIQLLTPRDPGLRSAIVTFRVLGRDNGEVASALARRRQRLRSVTEAGLDAVRASFHVCNTSEQVDELLHAIEDLVAGE